MLLLNLRKMEVRRWRNASDGGSGGPATDAHNCKICDCLFPINTLYYEKSKNDALHRRYGEIAKW